MAPTRSPIRLEKDAFISEFLQEKIYGWVCDEDRLHAAEFVQRDDPTKFAILHRSTKTAGGNAKWQVSFFDKEGPWGDSQETTCQRALREHLPRRVYRLRNVVTVDEIAAGRGRSLRANPSSSRSRSISRAPSAAAVAKYREFHRLDPVKIGEFDKTFRIPARVDRLGDAKHVLYRSSKVDPETLRRPQRPLDYIHDHEGGVVCYQPDAGDRRVLVDVPSFILEIDALVLLGQCLGFAFIDDVDGEANEVDATHPLPELYTIPSGKALLVVQDKAELLALMWGGGLGVESRGIVG